LLSKLRFIYQRLGEKLWIRPLIFCFLAVFAAFAAAFADTLELERLIPKVDDDTVEKLLSIIAASMLGVATFAVASMVSAYASVSSNATPRAFSLVISDDVSKTALSTFIAAFIFSVIALIAIKTGLYGRAGLFVVFIMTICVLAWVIFSFIRWVDQIARLGRLGTTIDRVEKAAEAAIKRRRSSPNLGAMPVDDDDADPGKPIFTNGIGYVQHVGIEALQSCAAKHGFVLTVSALPGTFVAPGRALAFLKADSGDIAEDFDPSPVTGAFSIGHDRSYVEDPRFGLIALSEIAARALSPAVNDPGTAIDIIGTFVRLFAYWVSPTDDEELSKQKFDRVRVPSLTLDEMFDDAFTAIARDGAGTIEVVIRLQKAFISLSAIGHRAMSQAASRHAMLSLARAENALKLPYDVDRARALAEKAIAT
jgi:uncharacterized membrane protein